MKQGCTINQDITEMEIWLQQMSNHLHDFILFLSVKNWNRNAKIIIPIIHESCCSHHTRQNNALGLIYHIVQPLKEHRNTMEDISICRCLLAVY